MIRAFQWDGVADQPVRVALAVPALVMVQHSVGQRGQRRDLAQQARANQGVHPHLAPLLLVEGARLEQDLRRDGDLAHIVQERAEAQALAPLAAEAQALGHGHDVVADLVGVAMQGRDP